jgi:hypothetical protein
MNKKKSRSRYNPLSHHSTKEKFDQEYHGEFPTTRISSMPLRIQEAIKVVHTAMRCGKDSWS